MKTPIFTVICTNAQAAAFMRAGFKIVAQRMDGTVKLARVGMDTADALFPAIRALASLVNDARQKSMTAAENGNPREQAS